MRFGVICFFVQNLLNLLSTNKTISDLKTFLNLIWNLVWDLSLKFYLNVFFYFPLNNYTSRRMTRIQYFTNYGYKL